MRIFGREDDLEALAALVRRSRLVTLTGPGGVGKTTLALALGERLGGASLVELAPVDPGHVAGAVADALGIALEPGETAREALLRALAGRRLLLVLDNFEHVQDAAPVVAELVSRCPDVTVVCTSRAPLRLSAEQRYPVEPLGAAAAEMFRERARARDPSFEITPANADAVATICRRVGGLPLGLELAAARIGFLSLDELASGLDDALALLVGGARDAPDRQRTLRATLDWSHRLLTEEERRAFAAFAAFAGGATLAAALDVTEAELPVLESLAAVSLVARTGARLTMLEPVRAYAAERLDAGTRRRHAIWCRRFAEATFGDRAHHARPSELAAIRPEAENLRAALSWALAAGEGELALALACGCGPWWLASNHVEEGRASFRAAFELAGDGAPAPLRARGLALRARFWGRVPGWRELRVADLHASLALARDVGDRRLLVHVLLQLSHAEIDLERCDAAIAAADEALALAGELGDDALLGRALAARAVAEPDHPDALRRAREAIPLLVRGEELLDVSYALVSLGYAATADGRLEEAHGLLEEALPVAEALGMARPLLNLQGNLGLVELLLGRDNAAAAALARSLEGARDVTIEEIDEALLALAVLAARRGDLEQAARLAGAGHGQAPPSLNATETRVLDMLEEQLAPARGRLGERRWDELETEGAALGREGALELGLAAAAQPRGAVAPAAE